MAFLFGDSSNESGQQIGNKAARTAVARMLKLRDVLRRVADDLNDGAFLHQDDIILVEQATLHVGPRNGDEIHLAVCQQLPNQFLIDITFGTKELAKSR